MPKYSGRVLAQARLPKGSRAAVKRTPRPNSGQMEARRQPISGRAVQRKIVKPGRGFGGHGAMADAAPLKRGSAPAEDSPGFKWYKHGNKTASLAHARRNPPPKGTTYAITGKYKNRTLVTARKARYEDDQIDPKTKVPYHMREVIKARRWNAAAKRRKSLRNVPGLDRPLTHPGDPTRAEERNMDRAARARKRAAKRYRAAARGRR